MSNRSKTLGRMALMSLAAILVSTAGAAAQPAGQPGGQPGGQPPLRGPNVNENRPPRDETGFGGRTDPRRGGDRGVPMRQYLDVVGALRGEQAPANVRLTAAQDEQINKINDDFRAEAEAFREKMRAEREKMQDMGEGQNLRERAREMMESAPRPADAQTKIWAVLTPDQQKHLQPKLDQAKAEADARRGEDMMRRREGQREQGGPMNEAQRERTMRIMERMRSLSPEDREAVLKVLEQELDKRQPQANPAAPGQDGAAPPKGPRRPIGRTGQPK